MCHDIQENQADIFITALNRKKMDMYLQRPSKMESERTQFSFGAECSVRFLILWGCRPKPCLEHGCTKVY